MKKEIREYSGFEPQSPYETTVIRIGNESTDIDALPVACVTTQRKEDEYPTGQFPLDESQDFSEGEAILVTPMIRRHPSGGSLTVYKLEHLP